MSPDETAVPPVNPTPQNTSRESFPSSVIVPPIAVNPAPTPDERTMAMLAELLQMFSWLIGPLIIYFVKRDSKFVRFHALQAVLWQVTLTAAYILLFAVLIAGIVAGTAHGGSANPNSPFPVLVMVLLYAFMGLMWLVTLIITIYFAVKAQSGEWARYPVIGRLAKRMAGVD